MSTLGDAQYIGEYHEYIGGNNKLITEFNECFGSKFSVSFRIDCRSWLSSNAAKNGNKPTEAFS